MFGVGRNWKGSLHFVVRYYNVNPLKKYFRMGSMTSKSSKASVSNYTNIIALLEPGLHKSGNLCQYCVVRHIRHPNSMLEEFIVLHTSGVGMPMRSSFLTDAALASATDTYVLIVQAIKDAAFSLHVALRQSNPQFAQLLNPTAGPTIGPLHNYPLATAIFHHGGSFSSIQAPSADLESLVIFELGEPKLPKIEEMLGKPKEEVENLKKSLEKDKK